MKLIIIFLILFLSCSKSNDPKSIGLSDGAFIFWNKCRLNFKHEFSGKDLILNYTVIQVETDLTISMFDLFNSDTIPITNYTVFTKNLDGGYLSENSFSDLNNELKFISKDSFGKTFSVYC